MAKIGSPKLFKRRKAWFQVSNRVQSKFDYGINLKSISVIEDAKQPENLNHYRPTHTGVQLLEKLAMFDSSACYMLQAAYGTGKSMHAALAVHIVENSNKKSKTLVKNTAKKVSVIDQEFGSLITKRFRSKKKGLALILDGQVDDIGNAIFESVIQSYERLGLGRAAGGVKRRKSRTFDDALALLAEIEENKQGSKIDRIFIVWDEFGRHLESLVQTGQTDSLHEIQKLAEFCVRRKKCPCSLALIMHQSFESYNTSSTATSRAEWKKIDGRFSKLKAGQDGFEFYCLMQDLGDLQKTEKKPPAKLKSYVNKLVSFGLFANESDSELTDLFSKTPAIDPVVYYLVPKISARLSQNERTVFDFMRSIRDQSSVGLDDVYSYFAPIMQADTSVGGSNKLFQQTKVALLKAGNEKEEIAIKACALMSIDVEEKVKVSRDLIHLLVANAFSISDSDKAVKSLIAKNLFIHRKHNNELLIWHGSDLDIRKDVKSQRELIAQGFVLLDFLRDRFPLNVWRPGRHNSEFGTQRYFTAHYVDLDGALNFMDVSEGETPFADGRVLYLMNEDSKSSKETIKQLQNLTKKYPKLCVVIPAFVPRIKDIALEIEAMEQLQRDFHKKGVDPASLEELGSYLDDSVNQIYEYVQKVYRPGFGQKVIVSGDEFAVGSPREFRERLSDLSDALYPKAPAILNHAINRNKPSGVMVNARKKLIARVLENTDEKGFGFLNPETIYEYSSAVASLFRTTLCNPGFYNLETGRFSSPSELDKDGNPCSHVWAFVKDFFTEPDSKPKAMTEFVLRLTSEPYGARRGILPILFAAGLRAFSTNGVLMKSGDFVEDIKPSDIDDALSNPQKYEFQVVDLKKWEKFLLTEVNQRFIENEEDLVEKDDLRLFAEAVALWGQRLPRYTAVTGSLSESALRLRSILFGLHNPAECIQQQIPKLYGKKLSSKKAAMEVIKCFEIDKAEIDSFYNEEALNVAAWIYDELDIGDSPGQRLRVQALAEDYLSLGEEVYRPSSKALLQALKGAENGGERDFVRGVTAVVTQTLDNWNDRSKSEFKFEFKTLFLQIFEVVFDQASSKSTCPPGIKKVLTKDLKQRLHKTLRMLVKLEGKEFVLADLEREIDFSGETVEVS